MRSFFAGLLLLVACAGPASAQPGGSNIALSDYPGPQCTKPLAPVVPPNAPGDRDDPGRIAGYNLRVKDYNRDVTAYNGAMRDFDACMGRYIANGNADMQRIKQRLDAAVAAANAH